MSKRLLASGLICGLSGFAAQLAIGAANDPASRPAAVPPPPADLPIPLLTLTTVQNVLERNVKWQQTAELALDDVKNQALRKQINQRLNVVAQQAASDLLAKPDSQAIVTIAIYKGPENGRQALAAVAYEGRSDHLSPGFYSRVISDLPSAPLVRKDQEKLVLDSLATCYLCFFLEHGNLDAGRIPHPLMKQSIQQAAQKFLARENEGLPQVAAAPQSGAARATAPPAQPSQPAPAPTPAANEPSYNSASYASNTYPYPNGLYDGSYYPGYWSPWVAYYPGLTDQPIIVAPQPPSANSQQSPQNRTPESNKVVPRDPKTGQPLPPESQRQFNQIAPRDPTTGQPAPPPQQTNQQNNGQNNAAPSQAAPANSNPPPAQQKPAADTAKQSTPPSAPAQQKAPAPPPKEAPRSESAPPSQNAPRQQAPPPANKKPPTPAEK